MTSLQLNRILYVEDEPDIRQVAQLALELVGKFTMEVCSSGEEALRALPRFRPDLILLDVMMPGMDGPTTLKQLRELPEAAGIPAIFMSAKVQPQEIVELKRIGALDVIPKPFDPMTLAQTVRDVWAAGRTRTTEKPAAPAVETDAEADKTLEQLCKQFAANLPLKIGDIVALWRDLRNGKADLDLRKTLHRKAHSLNGSAKTFGFADVSEAAQRLELYVKPLTFVEQPPDAEQLARIAELVDALESVARGAPAANKSAIASAFAPAVPTPFTLDTAPSAAAEDSRLVYLLGGEGNAPRELAAQLERHGFEAHAYHNADELMQACTRTLPCAVVADVDLNRAAASGVAAVTRMRKTLRNPPPVVFLSERDDLSTRLQAARAGSSAFFARPIKLGSLVDKLDELGTHVTREPYRVLIVEDTEEQALFYSAVLHQAGALSCVVSDPRELLDQLARFHPELVLMDMYLPDCSGDELARVIRQMEAFVGLPIVFLSVENNFDRQLSAMGRGGDEFLTKPILPAQLLSVVVSRIERYRTLRALMVQDSLTGLTNHSRLQQLLESEAASALRHDHALALAMIDIDHFKQVNDQHGHPTGDRVLRTLARFLRQRLRKCDVLARYGGEEFAAVLPGTDADDAAAVVDRLRTEFALLVHDSDKGAPFSITFSAGIASLPGWTGARELVLAADRALYAAKDRGRNCVVASRAAYRPE